MSEFVKPMVIIIIVNFNGKHNLDMKNYNLSSNIL